MEKRENGRRHSDSVSSLSSFAIQPIPRCCGLSSFSPGQKCGLPGTKVVRGNWWFDDRVFCDEHAPETAETLPAELAVRRVHLVLDVYIAGTSGRAPEAQSEALERVVEALHGVGAVAEVSEIHSTYGRYPAPAANVAPNASGLALGAPPLRQ